MYIILDRQKIKIICLFAAAFLFLGALITHSPYAGSSVPDRLTVIVDPGHGIPDGGAVGATGTIEQKINLAISQKLSTVLEGKGIKVVMTRSDESGLWTGDDKTIREMKVEDMHNRLKIMKKSKADLFLSIHMNYYKDQSASGLRVFYSANHEDIKSLAENIQSRMSDITGAGISVVKSADKKLFLMKNPPIPAILIECGFLSNPSEEKKLNDIDYQSRLAWAIADAVEKYYSTP